MIILFNDVNTIEFNKNLTQTNQDFDINVIFIDLTKKFKLNFYFFDEFEFCDLFMCIVDYNEVLFHY